MNDDWGVNLQAIMASLAPHLVELRRRLFIVLAAITVGVVVGFAFAEPILNLLAIPVGGVQNLQAIELTESIGVYVRVAVMVGGILAMPIIVYELVAFIVPGLLPPEKRALYILSLIHISEPTRPY